jgi:hypothetical protein
MINIIISLVAIFIITFVIIFINNNNIIVPILPTTTTIKTPQWVDKGCWLDKSSPERAINPEWINVQLVGTSNIYNFNNTNKIEINSSSDIPPLARNLIYDRIESAKWLTVNQPKYLEWAKKVAEANGFDVIGFQNNNEIFFGKQLKTCIVKKYNATKNIYEDTRFISDYKKYGRDTGCSSYGGAFINRVWELEKL